MSVRRESVRLDVEGNFKEKVLEDAAALEVLRRSAKNLSGMAVETSRTTQGLQRDIENTGKSAKKAEKDLDSYTGRLGILVSVVGSLAPALAPIGAVGIGGLAGLANDAGMATVALGSLVVAAHGVAPAIQAVNKAALNPTAANLQAAHLAMEQLSPAARKFVREFQGIEPILHQIQGAAASGWFPGLTQALHNLRPLAPAIERIFHDVGTMGGDLLAQGAKSLAGPQWAGFFKFIDTEAPKAMAALGHVIGSLAHGLAQLWMAFAPLNNSFNDWLVRSAASFDRWASGLSQTQGFQDFVTYLRENGPQVAQAASAIADAVIQIVQAAAPLGGPTLQALTAIAKILGAIANSPFGTPILLMFQVASAARIASAAIEALGGAFKSMGASAVVAGDEAKAAASGAGGRVNVAGLTALGIGLQFGANHSGTATSQNDFANASATGNLDAMHAAVADMQKHLDEWNKLDTGGLGGLGARLSTVQHPLDLLNNTFSDMFGEGRSGLQAKIDAAKNSIQELEAPTLGSGAALAIFGGDAKNASEALRQLVDHTQSAFDAETNWRTALVAAQKQAASNSAGLRGNSAAVLANRTQLSQLATAWNNQSDAVRNNIGRQHAARQAFIDVATGMGVPIKRARDLANAWLQIPDKKKTTVTADTGTASGRLGAFARQLADLKDRTVHVNVITGKLGGGALAAINAAGSAGGSTVPKDGGPYADRYPYLLAPGEEVISNRYGQADRHRALLKAINADHAANGATVGGTSSVSANRSAIAQHLAHEMGVFHHNLKDANAELAKEQKVRSALVSKMQQLSSSVQSNGTTDLFGTTVNPWSSQFAAGSPGTVLATLRHDIANFRTEKGAIAELKKKGIKGDALAQILAEGGLAAAQEYASLPASELREYQRLFNTRAHLAHSVGSAAASAAYGSQLAIETKAERAIAATVKRIEAEIKHANKQAHKDRANHTRSQKKGASTAGRSNSRRPKV